jgi:hypothetical protein
VSVIREARGWTLLLDGGARCSDMKTRQRRGGVPRMNKRKYMNFVRGDSQSRASTNFTSNEDTRPLKLRRSKRTPKPYRKPQAGTLQNPIVVSDSDSDSVYASREPGPPSLTPNVRATELSRLTKVNLIPSQKRLIPVVEIVCLFSIDATRVYYSFHRT